MKKIIIYSIIGAFTLLGSCRKSDNPNVPDLIRIPVPLITVDPTGDLTISGDDPDAFKGIVIVDNYFKEDTKPKKLDVVIVKNNDHSKVMHLKDDVTTYPITIEITGAQLASIFSEPVLLGDKFTIGANVTTESGQMYEAFPNAKDASGNYFSPYGSGITTQQGASIQVSFTCVCGFDINDFVGPAQVDDPYFFEDKYNATVSKEGDNLLKISNVNGLSHESFLIKLDPKAFTATVDKQIIDKDMSGFGLPYTNLAVAGKGTIDACNKSINLTLNWTVDQGSFGGGSFNINF